MNDKNGNEERLPADLLPPMLALMWSGEDGLPFNESDEILLGLNVALERFTDGLHPLIESDLTAEQREAAVALSEAHVVASWYMRRLQNFAARADLHEAAKELAQQALDKWRREHQNDG